MRCTVVWAHARMLGHRAGGPVGGLLRGAMQGVLDDALDALVVVVAFTASSRAVDEALESALVEASSPLRDGVLPRCRAQRRCHDSASLWPLAERCAL